MAGNRTVNLFLESHRFSPTSSSSLGSSQTKRQKLRHPTRNKCMSWFAQILFDLGIHHYYQGKEGV